MLVYRLSFVRGVSSLLHAHFHPGPEKELLQLAVFRELHALFPGVQVHIELIGPAIPQDRSVVKLLDGWEHKFIYAPLVVSLILSCLECLVVYIKINILMLSYGKVFVIFGLSSLDGFSLGWADFCTSRCFLLSILLLLNFLYEWVAIRCRLICICWEQSSIKDWVSWFRRMLQMTKTLWS